MDIHQQPDKDQNKHCPGKDVRPYDVEAEIGQEDEPKTFDYVELIGDLWIDLSVIVMLRMDASELGMVESKMEKEKERIVDKEALHQLKC